MAEIPQYQTKFEYQNRYAGRAQAKFSPTGFQVPQEQDTITDRVWQGVTGKVMEVGSQVAKERKLFEEQRTLSDKTLKMKMDMDDYRNNIKQIAESEQKEGETYRETYQRLWTAKAKEIENSLSTLPAGRIRDSATSWFDTTLAQDTQALANEAVARDDREFVADTENAITAAVMSKSWENWKAAEALLESRPDLWNSKQVSEIKETALTDYARTHLSGKLVNSETGELNPGWREIVQEEFSQMVEGKKPKEVGTYSAVTDKQEKYFAELQQATSTRGSPMDYSEQENLVHPISLTPGVEISTEEYNKLLQPNDTQKALTSIGMREDDIDFDTYGEPAQIPPTFIEANRNRYGDFRNWPTVQQSAMPWNSRLKKEYPEQWKAVQDYRKEIHEWATRNWPDLIEEGDKPADLNLPTMGTPKEPEEKQEQGNRPRPSQLPTKERESVEPIRAGDRPADLGLPTYGTPTPKPESPNRPRPSRLLTKEDDKDETQTVIMALRQHRIDMAKRGEGKYEYSSEVVKTLGVTPEEKEIFSEISKERQIYKQKIKAIRDGRYFAKEHPWVGMDADTVQEKRELNIEKAKEEAQEYADIALIYRNVLNTKENSRETWKPLYKHLLNNWTQAEEVGAIKSWVGKWGEDWRKTLATREMGLTINGVGMSIMTHGRIPYVKGSTTETAYRNFENNHSQYLRGELGYDEYKKSWDVFIDLNLKPPVMVGSR